MPESEKIRNSISFFCKLLVAAFAVFTLSSCAATLSKGHGSTSISSESQNLNLAVNNANINLKQHEKGDLNILLSIPNMNLFQLEPKNEIPVKNTGFLGLGLGSEYFYKNKKSLQFRTDAIMDIFFPAPVVIDYDYDNPKKSCYAFNVNFTDNFHIKRFKLGYGINYAKNTIVYEGCYRKVFNEFGENGEQEWIGSEWIDRRIKSNYMFGLAFNTYFRFSNNFYFGLIYRPSFYEISRSKFMYEHSISLDFMWKIKISNLRSKK